MKIFLIRNNFVHYDMTRLYSSVDVARTKYPATTQIVEAPDYVFEGWGFNPNENGNDRFIKPTPPEGWVYDEATGTFYNPSSLVEIELAELKSQLNQNNVKAVECFEATQAGVDAPYDMAQLYAERQSLKEKIAELEAQLPVAPDSEDAANKYGITDELLQQIKDDTVTEIEEAVINGTD